MLISNSFTYRISKLFLLLSLAGALGCSGGVAGEGLPSPVTAALLQRVTQTAGNLAAKPASVPNDFIVTPHGYFHPSCVTELNESESVGDDGVIRHLNGTSRGAPRCAHSHFDAKGGEVTAAGIRVMASSPTGFGGSVPAADGWVTAASAVTTPLSYLAASFNVPQNPANVASQILYYFPGIEPAATGDTIVQPVLGWNTIGSGPSWTMSSWNCCKYGGVFHSALVPVNPGDILAGAMTGSACVGNICSNWSITTRDTASGLSTTLASVSGNQSMNWAFGGVLEAYGVTTCRDYSTTAAVTFNKIVARTVTGAPLQINWSNTGIFNSSAVCGEATVIAGPGSVSVRAAYAPLPCGGLASNQTLLRGQEVYACNSAHHLALQPDGNLVLYNGNVALWSSSTGGTTADRAVMQTDGNFVLYNPAFQPLFYTSTGGHPSAHLLVQDDGNLVVYSSNNVPLWSSNTNGR